MKNILAVCGSLRGNSANLSILKNIAEMFSDKIHLTIDESLSKLPHFNPDLDTENAPPEVKIWRESVKKSDGVLICSPEYIFSMPGALKNALEWTVSSADFHDKPTALITASSLGEKAHESLLLVLKTIDAKIDENTALLISGARTKLDETGKISDQKVIESINRLMSSLLRSIENQ